MILRLFGSTPARFALATCNRPGRSILVEHQGLRALPFCQIRITAMRCPYPKRWRCTQSAPQQPQTIGEHLKNRRLELHLLQKEVARRIGVRFESVRNWEQGATQPTIRVLPKLIEFLGHNPQPEPADLPGRIAHARRQLGLTQADMAKALKIHPDTVGLWERGDTKPPETKLRALQGLLGNRFAISRQG
jgi:transcriptional regulator with XRE-family HTH domain